MVQNYPYNLTSFDCFLLKSCPKIVPRERTLNSVRETLENKIWYLTPPYPISDPDNGTLSFCLFRFHHGNWEKIEAFKNFQIGLNFDTLYIVFGTRSRNGTHDIC